MEDSELADFRTTLRENRFAIGLVLVLFASALAIVIIWNIINAPAPPLPVGIYQGSRIFG